MYFLTTARFLSPIWLDSRRRVDDGDGDEMAMTVAVLMLVLVLVLVLLKVTGRGCCDGVFRPLGSNQF